MIDNRFNKEQYSFNFSKYIKANPEGTTGGLNPKKRVDIFEKYVPTKSRILEIGCGAGLDSVELVSRGYSVLSTDAVDKFVEVATDKGLNTRLYDAKEDGFPNGFDAVYANAVFVHFSMKDFEAFLLQAFECLENDKWIFFSVMEGHGTERKSGAKKFEREYQYYQLSDIREIIEKVGFEVIYQEVVEEKYRWIQVLLKAKV